MTRTMSLRARLVLIILTPLMLISLILGGFAFQDAKTRANDRFDRSLLSTVLAISRDTALSGGDALSPATLKLLGDTSGGRVFYHVYAPNGAYVTGYATPPVFSGQRDQTLSYYDAIYQRRPVRALRFVDQMSINGLDGDFTFTAWQDTDLRDGFVRDTSQSTFGMIAIIMVALTLIVWFGVRIGLRPLLDLQDAISRRSARELSAIQRLVPFEVQGIVSTLNGLLEELRATIKAKDEFISNAAHQLRNPIAGVLAMSEAVRSAAKMSDVQQRSEELVMAAKKASALADSLLAFERAKSPKLRADLPVLDLNKLVRDLERPTLQTATQRGVTLDFNLTAQKSNIRADSVLLQQGVLNMINNALLHGGENLTKISIRTWSDKSSIKVSVTDDGKGIPISEIENAKARFGQVSISEGSGLGLPIAIAVAESCGGSLVLESINKGLRVTITLPLSDA